MSMTDVREVIDAPVRVPYRFGLFSVLDFDGSGRAGIELAWDSIGCGPLQTVQDPCLSIDGADHTKASSVECAEVGSAGFTVIAYDDSSLGRSPRGASSSRASDKLTLGEQPTVELALTGYLAAVATDVSQSAGAGASIKEQAGYAIGEVEQSLAEAGGEGVILVARSFVALLPNYFNSTGSVLRTKLGTPVAALGGWAAGRNDVLGVPALVARRGQIAEGDGYNLNTNDRAAYAERDYSFGWECGAVVALPSAT